MELLGDGKRRRQAVRLSMRARAMPDVGVNAKRDEARFRITPD